jgi:hypothetical protein
MMGGFDLVDIDNGTFPTTGNKDTVPIRFHKGPVVQIQYHDGIYL